MGKRRDSGAGYRGDEHPTEVETRYHQLLEHLPVGVYRTTAAGALVECNRALADMLGYADIAELQRTNVEELYVRRSDRAAHLAAGGERPRPAQFELRRKDGTTLWVRDYSSAVTDEDGSVTWYDGIIIDITTERRVQEALRRSEADYRGLFENAHDAILIFDAESETIIEANQRACDMYGYPRTEFVGLRLECIAAEPERGRERFRQALGGSAALSFEAQSRRKDGSAMTVEVNASAVEHQGRRAILSINRDVTERKRMEETIREMALRDPLTGLPNRKLLYDRLEVAIAAARRNRRLLALMYLDLDGFKEVNDRLGHAAGDELLIGFSRRLGSALRDSDTVGRMGGDEFTILIPEVPSGKVADDLARKLLSELRKPISVAGEVVTVTASLGFTLFPAGGETPDELLRSADAAMYRAKGAGKDRFEQGAR
jgi:diguanylate cyclase (GGDEF)-like protein/PAS domain S-box-containing protein